MNPATRCLEVGKKMPRGNQGLVGRGPLDYQISLFFIPRLHKW